MLSEVKIAHIADCHLRNVHYGSSKRGARFLQGVLSAIEASANEKANLILCCGDMLDSNNPGPAIVNWQLKAIHDRLLSVEIPMLVIQGNHDNCVPSWLTPYEVNAPEELTLPGLHYLPNSSTVWSLEHKDWPFPINIYTAGYCNKEEFLEQCKMLKNYSPDIVAWHGEIQEFCGFPLPDAIAVNEIPKVCQLLAMGHIHVHKLIENDGLTIAYPGSTELVSEDEDEHKQLYLYGFRKNMLAPYTAVLNWHKSVPFDTQPVIRRTIKTAEELEETISELKVKPDVLAFIRYDRTIPDIVSRLHDAADLELTTLKLTPMMPDRFNVHTMSREAVKYGPVEFFNTNKEDLIHDAEVRQRVEGLCKELLSSHTDHRAAINKYCNDRLEITCL